MPREACAERNRTARSLDTYGLGEAAQRTGVVCEAFWDAGMADTSDHQQAAPEALSFPTISSKKQLTDDMLFGGAGFVWEPWAAVGVEVEATGGRPRLGTRGRPDTD